MRWRSLLFVPAHAECFVSRAPERGAGAIILDQEDAVLPAEKDGARAGLPDAVRQAGQGGDAVLGLSVFRVDGRMVDTPVVSRARAIVGQGGRT